ncbi:MAG: hypothetical protein EZS28_003616 [Streblomastix strix]|uniref:Palmitoyltransferase n=1 Tax=Streblomastix strix TaxID=222440 RepID=A0A5J4X0N0_9EUKA|nr:MAG: hypothetical protein EZS28_003616 [Streblomastix strix]
MVNFAHDGKIDKTNVDAYEYIYPYDGVLNTQVKYCQKCGIVQPARSRHSDLDGYCLAKYDHFCAWIAGGVGSGNFRYFFYFLIQTWVSQLYLVITCIYIIVKFVVTKEGLYDNVVGENAIETLIKRIVVTYVSIRKNHQGTLGALALDFAIGYPVFNLFISHYKECSQNITQWEHYVKKKYMKENRKVAGDIVAGRKNIDKQNPPASYITDLIDDIQHVDITQNKYNRGLLNNIIDVFRPPHTWKIYKDIVKKKESDLKQEKLNKKKKEVEKQIELNVLKEKERLDLNPQEKEKEKQSDELVPIITNKDDNIKTLANTNTNKSLLIQALQQYQQQSSLSEQGQIPSIVAQLPFTFFSCFPDYFPNRHVFQVNFQKKEIKDGSPHKDKDENDIKKEQESTENKESENNDSQKNLVIHSFNEWVEIYQKLRFQAVTEGTEGEIDAEQGQGQSYGDYDLQVLTCKA